MTFPFAIDGVAVAVHPENSVKGLTGEQVMNIYSGKITDWKDLGGEPGTIDVYGREDGSGTRETFTDKLLGKEPLSPSVNVVSSNGAMKTAIAQDKRAIGYVGIGHLDASIAGVALDGALPTQENAASGAYKVVRDLSTAPTTWRPSSDPPSRKGSSSSPTATSIRLSPIRAPPAPSASTRSAQ